jgi:hypothetical protein
MGVTFQHGNFLKRASIYRKFIPRAISHAAGHKVQNNSIKKNQIQKNIQIAILLPFINIFVVTLDRILKKEICNEEMFI